MTQPHPVSHIGTPPFPLFEGRQVEGALIRISGATPLDEVGDVVVSVDDRVRMVAEYRVVGIRHYTDPKTGDLIREQLLKPLSARLTPWDPANPDDDGVIRAVQA